MKVLTVVGARPQFVKAAAVSQALGSAGIQECLVHTGQHYDHAMSQVFFDELGMQPPARNLGVGSASHGAQTAAMLSGIEQAILEEKPDWVLTYGDTNSTLAGALAAVKLHVPTAHVEAGLRSYNRRMPEEINRVATDAISDLLLAPTEAAEHTLLQEGIPQRQSTAEIVDSPRPGPDAREVRARDRASCGEHGRSGAPPNHRFRPGGFHQ
jgi:UDP-N-acetylglucosamine 2-epimerase